MAEQRTPRESAWLHTLNYQHLLYFWTVAREGGLVPAAKALRLTHPTLSAQIHALEDRLGEKLFDKVGRRLVLNEMGRVVFRYADEIFALGREMVDAVAHRSVGTPPRLVVGIVDALPKLVVRRLLEPALAMSEAVRVVCVEDHFDRLLADLSLHTIDVVLSDTPVPAGSSVRAFHHFLGETEMALFATPALADRIKRGLPESLHGAPVLLPLEDNPLRRALNHWFETRGARPRVVGEFADSALLKVFGGDGLGIFAAPTVVAREITKQHGVRLLTRLKGVRERFYAVSVERRLTHPAVLAIQKAARQSIFEARPARGRAAAKDVSR